jgi:hypothetical protein
MSQRAGSSRVARLGRALWATLVDALRGVRRAPGLAVAAVLCLGLGAAATTAASTLVSAVLLCPVPFPDADRLVRVWFVDPAAGARISLSIPDVGDLAAMKAFDAFAGTARVRATLRLPQGAERLRVEGVLRGYFTLVGVRPKRECGWRFSCESGDASSPFVVHRASAAAYLMIRTASSVTRPSVTRASTVGRKASTLSSASTISMTMGRSVDSSRSLAVWIRECRP